MARISSAGEVEIALHQLLTQQGFFGTGQIKVAIIGPPSWPTYVVALSADSAAALCKPLSVIPGGWAPYNETNWILSSDDAAAILKLAEMHDYAPEGTGRYQGARA